MKNPVFDYNDKNFRFVYKRNKKCRKLISKIYNNMSSVHKVSLVLEIGCLPYLLILYLTLACKTSGQPFDPLVKFILAQYLVVFVVKFVIFFLDLTN
jgi:hypothetical protein